MADYKITNPYAQVGELIKNSNNHYKTNLHTHSTYSDANFTMTEMIEGFYDNGIGHIAALYVEDSNGFSKHNKTEPTITEARVYVLDSAVVLMKNDTYATIEVDTTLAGKSEKVRIRMMNQDGTWLLDDPSY